MVLIHPSEEEKDHLRKMGETEVLATYAYCQSCTRILKDRSTAIPFLRGLTETQARQSGVPNSVAERVADKFEVFLKSKK
jgi:hypothetical protein